MRAQVVGLVALAGLCLAIPHGDKRAQEAHKNLHEARDENRHTVIVTSTIVETLPAAIIWVDEHGSVVRTQYNAPPSTAATQPTPIVPVPIAPTSPPVAAPASTPPTAPPSPASTLLQPSDSPAAAAPNNEGVQGGGFYQNGQTNQGNQAQQAPSGGSGYGICYDMISSGPCKDEATVNSDMAMLSTNGYKMVRTYDIGCDVGVVVKAAAAHGMKAFIGINSVANLQNDMQKLIGYISNANAWGSVDTVNVGNEVVNQGGSASAVIAAIGVARGMLQTAGYTGKVVTVDTFSQHLANPSICGASDYCAANAHSFFDSSNPSSHAGTWVMNTLNQISQKTGKPTVITESGWPYGGNSNGAAVASPNDQATAIASIQSAFKDQPGSVYIFQAFNALYKAPGPMGIEQKFGIFNHN